MNHQPRSFEDQAAVRENVPLLVGLMGPSGSGKTYSALRLATGIQQITGGDIYGIDTEARRMRHYGDMFTFRHIDFREPFGSLDYLQALQHCVKKGAKVIIVDSMSHEHVSPGGYLLTQDAELDRMAGDDWKKRERVKMAAWIKPAGLRQQMINGILQLNCSMIFCFRAKEKVKPLKNAEGKVELVEMGFMPIAGEELLFEQTVNCLLLPKSEGVPTWRSDNVGERLMMKCPRQFRDLFSEQKPLDESIGKALAEWARGGKIEATKPDQPAERFADTPVGPDALLTVGRAAAAQGGVALDAWILTLTKDEKMRAKTFGAKLRDEASEVDADREAARQRDEAEEAENGDQEAA
jgi:ABC-type oligopeptide transport system ATPase subunit